MSWAVLAAVAVVITASPASGSPVGCGALGGAIDNGDCHVRATEPGYTMDLRFPLDYPDEAAILDYLTQTRDGFVAVAGDAAAGDRTLEMDVTAESFRSPQTRSVVLTLFQDVGSAHPTTWYKSFTYDVERGRPVNFDTVFAPGALKVIAPIVRRQLESDSALAGSISADDAMDPAHYQNFAVTDDAVIFYFGRAELLPSYAGATSARVPREEIPPLLL